MPYDVKPYFISGTRFELDPRYKPLKPIGNGAYGVVISAEDSKAGTKVAIKKVSRAFEDLVDAKRILREIRLLRFLRHENIIQLHDIQRPRTRRDFEDIYLTSNLMETDLHRIIRSKQPLTDDHIQYFIYQILRGLVYIHSANVIHRDIKPSNLLVNGNCDLKICDFGLARGVDEGDPTGQKLTEYVVTRWYRAPEIMLSSQEYTKSIDMWAVGCVFAELLGRKPLFPGSDYIKQINLIISVLGTPVSEDMEFIGNEKARRYIESLPKKEKVPWEEIYQGSNPLAIDLLDRMLDFNPQNRITVEEALKHPYLASLHDPDDEPLAPVSIDFEWENNIEMTKESLQDSIFEEIMHFHPELAAEESNGSNGHSSMVVDCRDISTDTSVIYGRSPKRRSVSDAESIQSEGDSGGIDDVHLKRSKKMPL